MAPSQFDLISSLRTILEMEDATRCRKSINLLLDEISRINQTHNGLICYPTGESSSDIRKDFLQRELEQIRDSNTHERMTYYLRRLLKGLQEVKTTKLNDLNLYRWKEYDDILTDSLWQFDRRDSTGSHKADFWGNYIPQIPNQLMRRFTKEGEWVLDPFCGSGTTLIEGQRLNRNVLGVDLSPAAVADAKERLKNDDLPLFQQNEDLVTDVVQGDSATVDFRELLAQRGVHSAQLALLHPPYWNIIQFSGDKSDLSNAASVEQFNETFGAVVSNVSTALDKGRYLCIVIGDCYSGGEWVPLGFNLMQQTLQRGYTLKSIVVKNFEDTRGKMHQKQLWRYRALTGGFYIFKHEYVFIFVKSR